MVTRLDDGFATTITLANGTTLYEKSVTPPGLDGGGAIDTTTMRNTLYRTNSPKSLITLSECSVTVAYDPNAYSAIITTLNTNQLITVTFPDGTTIAFWGWLNSFTPGEATEGEQPTAEMNVVPSNHNNAAPPVEVAPAIVNGTTTTTAAP
tara:strand:- start:2 stop:454 length:453 start_codon:yes stop_codon:yes gene_type:complete